MHPFGVVVIRRAYRHWQHVKHCIYTYMKMLRRIKMVLLLLTPICYINKKLMSVGSVLGIWCMHTRLA